MKRIVIMLLAVVTLTPAYSQTNGKFNANNGQFLVVDTIAEALVALAMNNPEITSLENVAGQFDYQYRRTKTDWMDNIAVSGNLNEFSIKDNNGVDDPLRQSTQFPRYNIGVRVPLGIFVNNGKSAKAAYYKYQSTIDDVKNRKQDIRRQVLTYYEDYKMHKQMKALQQELLQDMKFLYTKTEEKFQKGEATLEAYTNSSRAYNSEKSKMVQMDRNLHVAEAQLESLIGMKLSDALQQISVQRR